MPRGKNTKEYQTVKKSYPDLSDAIASVIESVCERLLAEGLITNGQRAAASNGFVTAKSRASTVTGLLLNKVEQDTKYFQSLVGVLQQDKDTFGTVLEQMGVTVTVDDKSSSAVASGSSNGTAVTSTGGGNKDPSPGSTVATIPTAFSDSLSPTELVSWLSQQFQAKGLTLDPLGQKLIDSDINGEAFVDLKDSDLVEMEFTKGQRMKILKIIQSVKGGKEDNSFSQNQTSSKPVQEDKKEAPRGALDITLTIDDLDAVLNALWDARAKWKETGTTIGVDEGTLDTMKGSDNDCLRGTLKHWLKGVYKPGEPKSKPRTWRTLIEALRAKTINEEAMANKLEKEVSGH